MANIKSAMKRNRTNEIKRQRNVAVRSNVRTTIKKYENALLETDKTEATSLFSQATKALDKAVSKGVITKNAASRKKSRLAKRLNAAAN